jgi:hypothetical protein
MKKYEIYLPLKYNDGKTIEPEKIKQIREELKAKAAAIRHPDNRSGDHFDVGSTCRRLKPQRSQRWKRD